MTWRGLFTCNLTTHWRGAHRLTDAIALMGVGRHHVPSQVCQVCQVCRLQDGVSAKRSAQSPKGNAFHLGMTIAAVAAMHTHPRFARSSDKLRSTLLVALGAPMFGCTRTSESTDIERIGPHTSDGEGRSKGDAAMVSDDGDEASTDGSAEVETSGTNTETQSTHREESSETTDSQSTTDGTRRDGGSAAGLFTCNESVPLIPDHDTGFQLCDDGALRRTEVVACPNLLPRDEVLSPLRPRPGDAGVDGGGAVYDQCSQDSDCEGPRDYCGQVGSWGVLTQPYLGCITGCQQDSDCASNQICRCGDPIGQCVDATCTCDADCPSDSACVGVRQPGVCGPMEYFACVRADDDCLKNEDCPEAHLCERVGPKRSCERAPVCGRPFLVRRNEDSVLENRRAKIAVRSDWSDMAGPQSGAHPGDAAQLSSSARQALAEHWTDVALMEHASIAAFARFTLQLLELGAPEDLVRRAGEAQVDETRHARAAFAQASYYRGRAVGPQALAMHGALDNHSVEVILETVILEGCIGETRAALEAALSRDVCQLNETRALLDTICRDEARHAELAWRFVAWVLQQRPELKDMVRDVFERQLSAHGESTRELARGSSPSRVLSRDFLTDEEKLLRSHGVLTSTDRAGVEREVWDNVVRPCVTALCA